MKKLTNINLVLLIFLLFLPINLAALQKENDKNKKNTLSGKMIVDPAQSVIDLNNITSWVSEEGFHDWIVASGWNGAFPNGNFIGTIFSEGIIWGGIVNDGITPNVRVNGNTYGTGCYPIIRLYRVRPDYQTADLTADASNFFNIPIGQVTQSQIQELYDQYQLDWNEWPAYLGAPYRDVNENGLYESYIDTPGVPTASQTIYIKYDDSESTSNYGSPPIGLEISETYWIISDVPAINNVIYKKVDIVYTGGAQPIPGSYIDSFFVCQWSDPDVGNAQDDFAGCDTTLNLGYSYNASQDDQVYQSVGLHPPASGYVFLQGMSEFSGNPNDSVIFNFKWRKGYKYISTNPMNSFVYYAAGGTWSDPPFTYDGTLEFYNVMRGYLPIPHYPASLPFPSTVADYSETGCYLLAGDPVTGIGKIDGVVDPAGDRRILLINGPIHINLGDTVEIVNALVADIGSDYLGSITELRKNAYSADSAYLAYITPGFILGISPQNAGNSIISDYKLNQNYPNPFNPSTVIKYQIPELSFVALKIYDVLGNEIETLVNEEKFVGTYEITWYADNLPSGIYFYRLQTGSFIETKKMVLIR